MTAEKCFDLYCAKAQDKMTDVDPTKKTSLDFCYNKFKHSLDAFDLANVLSFKGRSTVRSNS
ncbi:hypothetical protein E4U24_000716 [Claviceps purpurea]|nr:hypothetical protein E4U27_000996 [Claviceps purpurea]KAG6232548.1 hypothetical protein E4U24_000716 [Claviceps purpurea]